MIIVVDRGYVYEEHGGKGSWKRYARRSRREEHVRMQVINFLR